MEKEEELFDAWINLSLVMKNNRYVTNLTPGEILICKIIFEANANNKHIRQIDIAKKTLILKSAINRRISSLEKKGIVEGYELDSDKKSIYYRLREEMKDLFLAEQKEILKIAKEITNGLSNEEIDNAIYLFNKIAKLSEQIYKEKRNEN